MKVRVYVGTTEGPVQVERITREAAPQSAVCLGRSTRVLPMSTGYDAFVRSPSGVIEREFGPFDAGGFRLDISGVIGEGESWQLGVFAAHALAAAGRLAGPDDEPGSAIWLTGGLDNDLRVVAVGHVPDKLEVSRPEFERQAAELLVTAFAPQENAAEVSATALPAGVRLVGVESAAEVLAALDLAPPRRPAAADAAAPSPARRSRRRAWHWAARIAVIVVMAAVAVAIWRSVPEGDAPVTAGDTEVAAASGVGEDATQGETPASEPAAAAAPAVQAAAEDKITVVVFERRPAPGETCAQVHFGSAEAETVPVPQGDDGTLATSRHEGLCGLGFEVRNPGPPRYVAARFDLVSGRIVGAVRIPAALSGNATFSGARAWAIELPSRTREALTYRLVVIAADRPLAEEIERLDVEAGGTGQTAAPADKGIEVMVLNHRVAPPG